MTQQTNISLALLKTQLNESLQLNLDEFRLEENAAHEYTSQFVGIHLQSAFQPIYDTQTGDLHGYEALLRPSLGNIQEATPDFAFSYAEASGKVVKLDRVSRTLHLLNYKQIFQESGLLFLNVHPSLLISVTEHGKVFERILHAHSVPTDRVVIEIRDFSTVDPKESLLGYERKLSDAIDNYHDRGYKIAIDNFGNEHSILSRLWKFKPDYVKFDKQIVQSLESDDRIQKTFFGLIDIIKNLNAKPIVTGIETQTQLDIAIQAGTTLLQGYWLGKPASAKNLQASDVVKRQIA